MAERRQNVDGQGRRVPLVIELGEEGVCNPIAKVFKRLQNGEEDSLPYFYQVFAARK